jgi:hypothetical protein
MKRVPLFAKPNLAKTIKPTESNYGNDSVLQNYFFFRINELFRKKNTKIILMPHREPSLQGILR